MACFRLVLVAWLLSLCPRAHALSIPPRPARGVADPDGVFAAPARARLEQLLEAYAQGTSARYAVAIFRDLERQSLEDFSIKVAEAWKVGSKQDSDGVLVVVAVEDRKIRIEVGYGLEGKLTDATCGHIIREQMAPRFREGAYAEGVAAALAEIDRHATGRTPLATESSPPSKAGPIADDAPLPRPYAPPGNLVLDEPSKDDFDLSDYLVIGIFAAAIIGFVMWILSSSRGGTDGLLDGGASSWGNAAGMTMSSSGSTWMGSSRSSDSSSSSSDSWGSSSGGSFGGGGASGSW